MSRFAQIPDIPDGLPSGLSPILQALKQNLDSLAGLRGVDKLSQAVKYGEVQVADIAKAGSSAKTIATTSGTAHDFTVSAGTREVTINVDGLSSNGSSILLIQLGDSGGIEVTGYKSTGINQDPGGNTGAAQTIGFGLSGAGAGTQIFNGQFRLSLLSSTTNTWTFNGGASRGDSATSMVVAAGSKSLSAELTTVRLTTVNGTDTFDAGSVSVISGDQDVAELARLHNYLAAQLRGEAVGT
jgi:hypothetical protein